MFIFYKDVAYDGRKQTTTFCGQIISEKFLSANTESVYRFDLVASESKKIEFQIEYTILRKLRLIWVKHFQSQEHIFRIG